MAFPLILVGIAVIVAAECASWLLNEMTDDEKKKQQGERERQQNLEREYQAEIARGKAASQEKLKRYAKEKLDSSIASIHDYREKQSEISSGIAELFSVLSGELKSDSASPARKSAIIREYARVEDANQRLHAYEDYLNQEEKLVRELFSSGSYNALIARAIPEPLLPLEWLYLGKLIIVEMNEVNKAIDPFGHRISFGKDKDYHQAIALNVGREFPVLITGRNKKYPNVFYGCVERGRLYLDHIRPGTPVEMEVYSAGSRTICQLGPGIVRAELPRNEMINPRLRMFPGQKVSVYPSFYDLVLRSNPLRPRAPIQVSMHKPASLGGFKCADIYIEADACLLGEIPDEVLFSESGTWTMVDYDPERQSASFGKGNIRLSCYCDINSGVLIADHVSEHSFPQIGIDIGFNLIVISPEINCREMTSWQDGVLELCRRCTEAVLTRERSELRFQQAKIFRRWHDVINYQLDREHKASIEFDGTIDSADGWLRGTLFVPLSEGLYNDSSLTDFMAVYEKLMSSETLRLERFFRVDVWDGLRSRYTNALSDGYRGATINKTESGIVISARFSSNDVIGAVKRFKISLYFPSTPLDRQLKAIEDFFDDRLVNPDIKNAILSPSSLCAKNDSCGRDIVFFSSLKPSQEVAVRLGLSSAPISLIQGPPGTGKTTVIVELIRQLRARDENCRILVVSQQHAAVDNALTRYLKSAEAGTDVREKMLRIGPKEKIDGSLEDIHFDSSLESFLERLSLHGNRAALSDVGDVSALGNIWLEELKEMKSPGSADAEELFFSLISSKRVIGSTCVGLAVKRGGVDALAFDVAIIDEAGRSTAPELLIPILRARRVILIGDHYQLPPSIAPVLREEHAERNMDFLKEEFLETSFFENIYNALPSDFRCILTEQFRMPPVIGDLVSSLFYSEGGVGKLSNGESVYDRSDDLFKESLYWVDVEGDQGSPQNSQSLRNCKEAEAICEFIEDLSRKPLLPSDVAIITPYSAQKLYIRKLLSRKWRVQAGSYLVGPLNIRVDTVDSFQGSEADIVCYSPVRSKPPISFILDKKRLNVSCSRAKKHLIFFGNRKFLSKEMYRNGEVNLFSHIMRRASQKNPVIKGA